MLSVKMYLVFVCKLIFIFVCKLIFILGISARGFLGWYAAVFNRGGGLECIT